MRLLTWVPRATVEGERRVAIIPDLVPKLNRAGIDVAIETAAGLPAGFPDAAYASNGALVVERAPPHQADVWLCVHPPGAQEMPHVKEGSCLIGFLQPLTNRAVIHSLAARRVSSFAMELMPRITRAQPMDALSAMSTVAGYKAVLIAAERLPRFFPLLMTAAGTVSPAHVFVIGAGVAGLQAIGTAKRLGAVVQAYDTRPAVREQVESLGAKFVELVLETKGAEEKTGYAKAQSEEFYTRQRELMAERVAGSDVVITTALVPGQRAPILITDSMVRAMRPGSVIVDLAAEQSGNCELTEPGAEVEKHGVTICGPINLPSTVPFHASQMYARTVTNFLLHLVKDGRIRLDLNDELTRGPLVTHQGDVVHESVKAALARD